MCKDIESRHDKEKAELNQEVIEIKAQLGTHTHHKVPQTKRSQTVHNTQHSLYFKYCG